MNKFTTEPTTYMYNSETDITITSKEITFEASSVTTARTTKSSSNGGSNAGKSTVNDVFGIQKEENTFLQRGEGPPLTSLLENTALVKPINDNNTTMIENTTTVSVANTLLLQNDTETSTIATLTITETATSDTTIPNTDITHENTFESLKVESLEASMEEVMGHECILRGSSLFLISSFTMSVKREIHK